VTNERNYQIVDTHRAFLTSLAHRITANWADAEDLVSQASVRAQALDFSTIENPRAFLATMVTNIAINHVNSARVRREIALAPEDLTLINDASDDEHDLADALGQALDLVLSRLSPTERMVFLLREVFQFEYREISELLEESEANCRQLLKRAREKLAIRESRFQVKTRERELALERFLAASRTGNLDELIATVAPGVVLSRDPSDSGMPEPPPVFTRESVIEYLQDYVASRDVSWNCYRVSDRYEIAMLRGVSGSSAIICGTIDGVIERLDQITCPKRLRTLTNLFGLNGEKPQRIGE
jgi:RNA polymerase sigma-70 factor (ECF subfamily)